MVGAGRRQGGSDRDWRDSWLCNSTDSPLASPPLSSTGHLRGLLPLLHRQQSHLRGRMPAIPLGHLGFYETSRRAQRPRRPLLGPVPLQNPLPRNLPLPEPPPSDTRLPVLQCGNPTILYHLPPHPTSIGRAPPLPSPFSLRAATLEEGPSSFGWGQPFGWGHLWCKCHQQLGITRFLGMINFPRLKGRLKFRSEDYATAQY